MDHHSPPNHHTQASRSSANLGLCELLANPYQARLHRTSGYGTRHGAVVGARPRSHPTIGVVLDPSEGHVLCPVLPGESRTGFYGEFVAGGNEGRDSQPVRRLVIGSKSVGLRFRGDGCARGREWEQCCRPHLPALCRTILEPPRQDAGYLQLLGSWRRGRRERRRHSQVCRSGVSV